MVNAIYIRWLDSATTKGWQAEDANEAGPIEMETVGWLLREDEKQIQVAQSKHIDGLDIRMEIGEILAIPKVAVLKRRKIKLA